LASADRYANKRQALRVIVAPALLRRIRPMLRPLACALILATPPVHAAEEPPYIGTWDCEVSTFIFTADTYDSGEGPMPILKSEQDGGAYTLTFADDYRIGLANITASEMDWASEASGDTFHCKKIRN
jgi:hypothetical protein